MAMSEMQLRAGRRRPLSAKAAPEGSKGAPFKLTPPRPFIPTEFDEQEAVFDWLKWHAHLRSAHMAFASMAGVKVPIGLAKKMKRAGNKPGVPDIIMLSARGGYFGLMIELKRIKQGVVSAAQDDWLSRLADEGYCAVVAHGAAEAIRCLDWYLALSPTRSGATQAEPPSSLRSASPSAPPKPSPARGRRNSPAKSQSAVPTQ